jgi:hypothetical protein
MLCFTAILPWNALFNKRWQEGSPLNRLSQLENRRERPSGGPLSSSEIKAKMYFTAKTAKGVVHENYPTRFLVTHDDYLP